MIPGKGRNNACLWTNNKTFLPRKQGLKTNQILQMYVLNIILEIHLSDIPSLAVLETRLHSLLGKKQNKNEKKTKT